MKVEVSFAFQCINKSTYKQGTKVSCPKSRFVLRLTIIHYFEFYFIFNSKFEKHGARGFGNSLVTEITCTNHRSPSRKLNNLNALINM